MASPAQERNPYKSNRGIPPNAVRRPDPPQLFDSVHGCYVWGMPPAVTLADGTPYPTFTREDALHAHTVHANGLFNADGTCMRYRRNGQTKTWQTRPGDYRMPVKHGMRDYAQITPDNAYTVHTEESCPFAHRP